MKADEIRHWVGRMRREALHLAEGRHTVDASRQSPVRVLPHREPFLLVDRIVEFDPTEKSLLADYTVRADDPVFQGHFPGNPLYPAALQIEAIGQAGLCLWSFAENDAEPTDLGLRVARVDYAAFVHPVVPNDVMQLHTRMIHSDDFTVAVAGQVFVEGTLCSMLIIAVVIVDD